MPAIRTRDGRTLHVRVVGRGPVVVLLHGFAMHGGMWLPAVWPLARRYRFVLPDFAGFGRSHHVPFGDADAIRGHARDVADVMDALGERKVLLAGLSMGALTALRYFEEHGTGRVSRYVHMDQAARIHNGADFSHGLFGSEQPARFAELRAILDDTAPHRGQPYRALPRELRRRIHVAFAQFFRVAFRSPWLKAATRAMEWEPVATSVLPVAHWHVYLDTLRCYLEERYDLTGVLSSIDLPVTFFVGDASEMYPAEGQLALARQTPGAEVVRFPRTGHALSTEAPRRFVRELGRALATSGRAARPPIPLPTELR